MRRETKAGRRHALQCVCGLRPIRDRPGHLAARFGRSELYRGNGLRSRCCCVSRRVRLAGGGAGPGSLQAEATWLALGAEPFGAGCLDEGHGPVAGRETLV